MCPRRSQCFIQSAEVAHARLRELRGDPRQADALVNSAKVIGKLTAALDRQSRFVGTMQKTARALQALHDADPDLFSRNVSADRFSMPVSVSGAITQLLTVDPHTLELDLESKTAADLTGEQGLVAEVPAFDYAAWHAEILGTLPWPSAPVSPSGPVAVVDDSGIESGPLLPESALLDSPIMRAIWRAALAHCADPAEPWVMMAAFVCCVADCIGAKRPTPTHWTLIEVAAGRAPACFHAPHEPDNADCKTEYAKRIDRWEPRMTTKVKKLIAWLKRQPRPQSSSAGT